MAAQIGTVKSILSSDTIVLRGKPSTTGAIPKERVLHLSGLDAAPRLGNRDRSDEVLAFEAREFLRTLLVGKEVKFTVVHSTGTAEFGSAIFKNAAGEETDIATAVVGAGFAKVREGVKARDEAEESKKAAMKVVEGEAKLAGKGLWGLESGGTVISERSVDYSFPEDPITFLSQNKNISLDAIIEAVPNGSTIRARLLLSPNHHQIVNLSIAGIRAPRATGLGSEGSVGEEYGDEGRYFVESRLLQRQIKVTLLSLPTTTVAPSSFNSTNSTPITPPTPTFFLGTVAHPAGNIAALLLSTGLAKIVDWHAGFLSQSNTPNMMAELRKAEGEAKNGRRALWKNLPAPTVQGAAAAAKREVDRKWEGIVTRVWGADMLTVVRNGEGKEYRLQLSSVRQPRASDPRLAGLQVEGKELLRKKMIGKPVSVVIDYTKAAEGDYEARDCATLRTHSGANIAELLVEKGLLSVIRHRSGDEQKSSAYDALLAAEAKALAATKGIHSGKDFPIAKAPIDASETATKATGYLAGFKRGGRIPAVVDFVASGSRFKVFVPKQNLKLTLVLSGIRTPRTARNPSEKSEAFGLEAAAFTSNLCLQRDVEILFDSIDKTGGYIGKMFIGAENVAVMLVKEGLAKVDEYATVARELIDAQAEAQKAKKNMWKNFDAEADDLARGVAAAPASKRSEYVDLVVSDVREDPFSFAVQILSPSGGIPALESLMGELQSQYQSDVAPANFAPRTNDLVAAQFTADNAWYRGKLRKVNPAAKTAEILYIDYGNSETISFARLRPLLPQFKSLDGQAREATLSFINLLGPETEYGLDSKDLFRELCEGRQLVGNVDARDTNLLHLSLFDPADPSASTAHEASINVLIVREGLARVDTRSRFREAYPSVVKALENAMNAAKRSRRGAYELGDIFED